MTLWNPFMTAYFYSLHVYVLFCFSKICISSWINKQICLWVKYSSFTSILSLYTHIYIYIIIFFNSFFDVWAKFRYTEMFCAWWKSILLSTLLLPVMSTGTDFCPQYCRKLLHLQAIYMYILNGHLSSIHTYVYMWNFCYVVNVSKCFSIFISGFIVHPFKRTLFQDQKSIAIVHRGGKKKCLN